jgi:hypothetical protein
MRNVAACLLVMLLFGCTKINVKKVKTGTEEGIWYALPQPFLVVTPKSDGTYGAEVMYFADTEHRYAVTAKAKMSTYTLNMGFEDGMLVKAKFGGDTSAVGSKAAEAFGEIAQKGVEAEIKQREDDRTYRREQDKALQAKIDAAQTALDDARFAFDLARVKCQKFRNSGVDVLDRKTACAEKEAAELKVTRQEQRLNELRSKKGEQDESSYAVPVTEGNQKAWGPVFFRIVDDPESKTVRLEAVSVDPRTGTQAQIHQPTHGQPKAETTATQAAAPTVALKDPNASFVLTQDKPEAVLPFEQKIEEVKEIGLLFDDSPLDFHTKGFRASEASEDVLLRLVDELKSDTTAGETTTKAVVLIARKVVGKPDTLPQGTYKLSLAFQIQGKEQTSKTVTIELKVQ